MKHITARIQPHRLDPVREAMVELEVVTLTATEVRVFGQEMGHSEIHRGTAYKVGFMPMVKLEVTVADDKVDSVVEAIRRTGAAGALLFRIWIADVTVAEVSESTP